MEWRSWAARRTGHVEFNAWVNAVSFGTANPRFVCGENVWSASCSFEAYGMFPAEGMGPNPNWNRFNITAYGGSGEAYEYSYQERTVEVSLDPNLLSKSENDKVFCNDGCSPASSAKGRVGDGIETYSGSLIYPVEGMSIPTSAGDLSFRSTYVSSAIDKYTSPMGNGWTHNQDIKLTFPSQTGGETGFVLFKHPSGNVYKFWDTGQNRFAPYGGLTSTLTKNTGTPVTYTVKDQSQNEYIFNEDGAVISYTTSEGKSLLYEYDNNGLLESVSGDNGTRTLIFDYTTQGKLSSVTDHTGRTVEFTYNAIGDLITSTDVLEQTWEYEYDQEHHLLEVTDPSNNPVLKNEYYVPPAINFNEYTLSEYADEDGSHSISIEDNGNTLHLTGNTWKRIDFPYTITPNTIIEFDFKSANEGEQQGFGFETNDVYDPYTWIDTARFFQLYGNDTTGGRNLDFNTYSTSAPASKHYVIAPYSYYRGKNFDLTAGNNYLLFMNDHDIAIPTAESYFSNFKIYESTEPVNKLMKQYNGENELIVELEYEKDILTGEQTTIIIDGLGKETTHKYNSEGGLIKQIDPEGGEVEKVYDGNFRPIAISDANGETTSLTWSEDGVNLTNIVDAEGNETTIGYNSENKPTSIVDLRNYLTTFSYDGTLLESTTNALNQTTTYTYTAEGYLESVTDAMNHTTSYVYDSHGQRISMTDPMNHTWEYIYDSLGRLTDTEDPLGHITHHSYDAAGRLTSTTQNYDPSKAQNEDAEWNIVTSYSYDSRGNQLTVTDTFGRVIEYQYDNAGRLIKTVDPDQNETVNTYNNAGQLISTTDALGHVTSYGYDDANRLILVTDGLGGITHTTYNLDGTVANTTDALGNTTSYIYDSLKRVVTVTQPTGGQTHSTYDEAGNLATTTDALGNETVYRYDALNRLIKTEDALGNFTETFYDAAGHVIGTKDARGFITTYEYDAAGRQVSVTDALGNTTTYEYDVLGRRISVTDANGNETTFDYDALSRMVLVTDALQNTTTTTYDALGRMLVQTDANNNSTRFAYDLLDRVISQTNALNYATFFGYDDLGNRTSVTDANLHTSTIAYDALNRPITFIDGNGNSTSNNYDLAGNLLVSTDGLGNETKYTYNALNQPYIITDSLGNETTNVYNARGDLILVTDAEGVATKYEYDELGRLKAVIENYQAGISADAETNVRTEYTYDENGNRISILDANGHLTTFEYDALNRLITESDPLKNTWTYGYDAVGYRISMEDANTHAGTSGVVTTYSYDDANRLILIDYAVSGDVSFGYDDGGRRISMTDDLGITTWTYDDVNRILSVTDPNNQVVQYEYDAVGNKTDLTYPDNSDVSYIYDSANRLTNVLQDETEIASYQYDAANRLTNIERQNNVNTAYSYDVASRLLGITHVDGVEVLSSFAYEYDKVGNRIQAIENVLAPAIPPTVTPTATVTNTPTSAITNTPTATFTSTNTALPASTYTETATPTNTPAGTATRTPTITRTPTVTRTPSKTATPTKTKTPTPTATAIGSVFVDGFESGNLNTWHWTETDGGDLSVTTQAAGIGTYGMQAAIDDGNELVIYDDNPNNETHYSARFYFDPNAVQINEADGIYMLGISNSIGWVACLNFEEQGDIYSLQLCGHDDSNNWLESERVLLNDEWQAVEVEWQASSGIGANDGFIKLYIGDELVTSINNIDSDTQSVTDIVWGLSDIQDANGTVYFDGFASSTGAHIGLDANGPAVSAPPARTDVLFADGFESGDFSAWSQTMTIVDGGDLSTSTQAAYQSAYGMQALIDDTTAIYAYDKSPADETHYHARFYFNPNSISMSSGSSHIIFDGYDADLYSSAFQVELVYESGAYKLRPRIRNDAGASTNGNKQTISNDWHVIEIEWQASSAVGANDGYLSFWIDEALVQTISGIDNDRYLFDQAKLGAVSGVDSTTSGSMFFDHFVSRRDSYIGAVATPTPTATQTETPTITPEASSTPTFTPTPTETSFAYLPENLFLVAFKPPAFPNIKADYLPYQQTSTTTTIDYEYDALHRLTSANYNDGRSFNYEYDAVGNVLQYAQTQDQSTVVTAYSYNIANQLATAQMDNSSVVWELYMTLLGD